MGEGVARNARGPPPLGEWSLLVLWKEESIWYPWPFPEWLNAASDLKGVALWHPKYSHRIRVGSIGKSNAFFKARTPRPASITCLCFPFPRRRYPVVAPPDRATCCATTTSPVFVRSVELQTQRQSDEPISAVDVRSVELQTQLQNDEPISAVDRDMPTRGRDDGREPREQWSFPLLGPRSLPNARSGFLSTDIAFAVLIAFTADGGIPFRFHGLGSLRAYFRGRP